MDNDKQASGSGQALEVSDEMRRMIDKHFTVDPGNLPQAMVVLAAELARWTAKMEGPTDVSFSLDLASGQMMLRAYARDPDKGNLIRR